MRDYTAEEAHKMAEINRKAIAIAKGIVVQASNQVYESGDFGYGTFSIPPAYKSRVIEWIHENYPHYRVTEVACVTDTLLKVQAIM